VSLASGAQVVKAVEQTGHAVRAVDSARGLLPRAKQKGLLAKGVASKPPKEEELALLRADAASPTKSAALREVDVVLLALHGGTREDGSISARLDLAGIAYTGTRVLGSATAIDKGYVEHLFRPAGVTTLDWLIAPVVRRQHRSRRSEDAHIEARRARTPSS
jgi:D-alanine-D-alanine ligase